MIVSASVSPDPALAPAFAAAQQICRRQTREMYLPSFFLPPAKRRAGYAVGAFCRMIVEALDVPTEQSLRGATAMREHPAVVSPARSLPVIQPQHDPHCDVDTLASRLDMLRDRLDEIYAGQLELPAPEARSQQQHALYAFAETVRRYEIQRQPFLDLAEGCRQDQTVTRYANWQELENHCYRCGGVVALILSGVLGLTHSDAHRQVISLGSAIRLTHVLGNVKADLEKGRVYLPQEDLDRFGYTLDMLWRGVMNERFRELMRFQIDRARQLYRDGAHGLCWLAGDGSRLAASVLAINHAGVLDAIVRHDYDVLLRRGRVTAMHKLARFPRAVRLARRQHDQPLPDVF